MKIIDKAKKFFGSENTSEVEKVFVIKYDYNAVAIPSEEVINRIIFENNEKFSIWRDAMSNDLMIRCINIPRNSIIYGLTFKEIQ